MHRIVLGLLYANGVMHCHSGQLSSRRYFVTLDGIEQACHPSSLVRHPSAKPSERNFLRKAAIQNQFKIASFAANEAIIDLISLMVIAIKHILLENARMEKQ